jgi:hypothetical protein
MTPRPAGDHGWRTVLCTAHVDAMVGLESKAA